jgi:membrane-associated phospholipid phosphatase
MKYIKDLDTYKFHSFIKYLETSFINIGFNMPVISLFIAVFYLYIKKGNIENFLFFYVLSLIVNITLKLIIKQPRPIKSNHDGSIPGNSYGMPSGHVQTVSFVFFYLYFLYPDNIALLFIALISIFITYKQRLYCHKHTSLQVNAGFFVGFSLALLFSNIKLKI